MHFDNWYSGWQEKMRSDPILRWLVDARNQIEKQGDLVAKSVLRVTSSASSYDATPHEIELPPILTPDEVAEMMRARLKLASPSEAALIKVERRWVETELPDHEILDALVHCFSVLQDLVRDAHSHLLERHDTCQFMLNFQTTDYVLPEFMLNASDPRIRWIKLQENRVVDMAHDGMQFGRDVVDAAEKHYQPGESIRRDLAKAKTFREECLALFQMGKRILEVDGRHGAFAFMRTEQGMQMSVLGFDDRAEKHIVIRDLAETAKRLKAKSVVLVNEAWLIPVNEFIKKGFAAGPLGQKEALVLHGLSSTGEFLNCQVAFDREDGNIKFGHEEVDDKTFPNILAPFLEIWGLQIPQTRSKGTTPSS